MPTPTLLLVDDERDILEMLSYNLEKEGYRVLQAQTGEEALQRAMEAPDAIVLDVMMPGLDGFEVCRRLRADPRTAVIPVLFLTAKSSEVDHVVGLEIGADDFLTKPISIHVLTARIRALLRRSGDIRTRVGVPLRVEEIGLVVDSDLYHVTLQGAELTLPKKEFELLHFLVQNRGRVFSRQNLLNAVWGQDVYVIDRTVDVHIRKIREKLGNHSDMIETVKGVGYRFRG